jgi:heme-degrading monooxygenase HmoA
MFIRMTFCKFLPERIHRARTIFNEEIMPAVRKQKGNLSIRLLEPTNRTDDFISISEWKTLADAEAYEASGTYQRLVGRLEPFFIKQPELRTYNVEEARVRMDSL